MRRIGFFAALVFALSTAVSAQDAQQATSSSAFGSSPLSRCPVCRRFHSPHCTPPPVPPPTSVPIDGGLSLLLIAGAGYGVKRIKAARGKQ